MKMKKIFALVLTVVLAAALFTGCDSKKYEALAGTWTMTMQDTEEQLLSLLDSIEAYEEEIALVDMESLYYVRIVEFDLEKNYRFAYDVDATKDCLRDFFEQYFADLFAGRETLNDAYGQDFGPMSREDFKQFYADLYGYDTYEALIDHLVANQYDWASMSVDLEVGTFTIAGSKLMCKVNGLGDAEALGYAINGNQLTLTYSDDIEVYTKG